MEIYRHWYDYFDINISHTVYLKTSVENCIKRINQRGREAEMSINKGYLQELEDEHDKWLLDSSNSTILNGNLNFLDNPQEKKWLITGFQNCIQELLANS